MWVSSVTAIIFYGSIYNISQVNIPRLTAMKLIAPIFIYLQLCNNISIITYVTAHNKNSSFANVYTPCINIIQ